MLLNTFNYLLCLGSSATVSFFLPFARRLARTRRPFADSMRLRNPCLLLLFLLEGWNVRFIFDQYCDYFF